MNVLILGINSRFTMVLIFIFFHPVPIQNFYQKECFDFNIYSTLSFRKLDQDFREVTFRFSQYSYLMPREKPPTNYEKPLKMGF